MRFKWPLRTCNQHQHHNGLQRTYARFLSSTVSVLPAAASNDRRIGRHLNIHGRGTEGIGLWPPAAKGRAQDFVYVTFALAFCSSTSRLQGCMSGAPVASESDTCIPGWRRPTRDGHCSPSSAFSCRQDMLRPTDTEQFRRSKLQCGRPACVEQFATAPTTRHELCAFPA